MNERKRWATKEAAKAYLNAYSKRVDTIVKANGETKVIPGPKGLSYWAAHDYVYGK